MIQKHFDSIGKADIDALVGAVPESKTIEYKIKLPGPTEDNKKEFLADIAAFASTSGGGVIYGLPPAVEPATHGAQSYTIAAVRDALLPRLLSGQIRL